LLQSHFTPPGAHDEPGRRAGGPAMERAPVRATSVCGPPISGANGRQLSHPPVRWALSYGPAQVASRSVAADSLLSGD
jgi:hypothetical protein